MKQIIFSLLLIIGVLSSCLKEEENLFGQSSAERLMAAAKEYEEILSSAENGWVMDYFAEFEENKMGGYQMLCKFDKGKVTMAGAFTLQGKYTDPGKQITSSYRFVYSQGPVLSFDGYNDVLHGFADPGRNTNPDGFAGDTEFVVVKATKDEVVMRGVKRGLKIVMRPMEAAKDWNVYCEEVLDMQEKLSGITRFSINKSGSNIGFFTFWTENNEVHNTEPQIIEATKYTISNKGVNFYDSLTINENTVLKRLNWDDANLKFTDYNADTNIDITPVYINFENLLGTYKVTYDNMDTPVTVTFSLKEDGKKIRVSEELIGYEFDIDIYGDNKLSISPQLLAVKDNQYIKLRIPTVTDFLILTSGVSYSNNYTYNGSWYRGTIEKPEIRFLKSSFSLLFLTTYSIGMRVVIYDSTHKDNIIGFEDIMITNPIFVKQ